MISEFIEILTLYKYSLAFLSLPNSLSTILITPLVLIWVTPETPEAGDIIWDSPSSNVFPDLSIDK